MKKLILSFSALAITLSFSPFTLASFSDVPASHPNYEAINYVQAKGFVQGYPDGTYQPNKLIDRYEFTKIIVGALYSKEQIEGCKTSPFKDVPMDWFTPYVCLAQKEGIVGGYPDGNFQGTNQIKLVEAAKILVEGFNYPVTSDPTWYKPYIIKLEEHKALPTTLTGFEHLVTRGEMAEFIERLHGKIVTEESTSYGGLELVTVEEGVSEDEITIKAFTYLNRILEIINGSNESYIKYKELVASVLNSFNKEDLDKLEINRQNALTLLKKSNIEFQSIPPFLDDATLKNAYINATGAAIQIMEKEYKELNELLLKTIDGEINQVDEAKAKELNDAINKVIQNNLQETENVIRVFASKFGVKLIKDGDDNVDVYNYMNNILIYQSKGTKPLNNYTTLSDSILFPGDYEMLEEERIKAMNETKQFISEEVASLEAYQGDLSLRDALIQFFNDGLNVLAYEQKELINLRIKMAKEGSLSQADLGKVSELYDSTNEKLANSNEVLNTARESFSQKHGVPIN